MRIIIYITPLLLFYSSVTNAQEKDVNIYMEVLGNTVAYTPTLELNIHQFNFLGAENRTYLKAASSTISFFNIGKSYSFPVIGINHYIGKKDGADIGVVYFHKYYYEQDLDADDITSIYDLYEFDAIGFNFGYREYGEKTLFRITYTPFYNISDKEFINMLGVSFGWYF